MKQIFLAIALLTLLFPASRRAEAGVEVSVDFFYDNLGSDGSWVELEDYGYCWQPTVAVSNSHWRPYADGYWAYTDVGWTWVSYEDFGWATYHYGRWARLHDRGWFWVPGREWGPAWVSWRTGGNYIGWAPLPPRGAGEVVYDGSPIAGQVDVEFNIGPAYYNFVDVRYIGEPVLRERIFQPHLNITYITQTVNVTNITYVNSTVYNHGPDYNQLSQYSTRPIRRMTLEHDANADLSVGVKSKGLTRVQGDKLIVAAPMTIQKSPSAIVPKTVKEKITKPKLELGWGDVSDPKTQADLRQKMKSQDPKTALPPSIKPHDKPETALPPVPVPPRHEKGVGATQDAHPHEAPTIPHQPPPPKLNAPPDTRPKQPLPSDQVAPPKVEARPDVRPKQALPPEPVAPRQPDVPRDIRPRQLQPPERVAPPKLDAPRPLPPERAAPPKLETPPVRVMPPRRDSPPVLHQPPPQRLALPPGPPLNGPVRTDVPRSNRPPDKKVLAPTPPSGS